MTVQELYEQTKGIMFEKSSSTIYDNYVIPNVNRLIRELFEENNSERMWNDKPPLSKPPYVTQMTDELKYEDVYVREIMPLGLSAYFFIDDDLSKYSIYITDYKNSRIIHQRIISKEKFDELAGNS